MVAKSEVSEYLLALGGADLSHRRQIRFVANQVDWHRLRVVSIQILPPQTTQAMQLLYIYVCATYVEESTQLKIRLMYVHCRYSSSNSQSSGTTLCW